MSKTHNAGIVTAYGAAVRGGYVGTYEEFCAQQAQYAENARQMEQAVSDVRQIKTSVESAVSEAETYASNANQSAANASDSATQASQSASNANQSAESASRFADNASNSADDAEQSATSAQISANNASESEQNAQQSAEDAANVLSNVYTKSEIDSAISKINGSLEQLTELHLNTISGYISSGGALVDSTQSSEVTTSWVSVKTGDVIITKVQYNNSYSGWGCVSLRGINYEWIKRSVKSSGTSNTWFYEYTVENDGYVAVSYRTYDDVLDAKYYIVRCATNYQISDISRHGNNIGNIYINYDGGINSNGNINQNENTYHTELITVDKNAIISYVVDSRHLNVDTIYVAIVLYDHNKTFIKRVNISNGEIKTTFLNGTIAIKDIEGYENIKYVSVVHKHDANSFFGISFIATELQKIEPKYEANFKKSPIRSVNHRGYNTVAPENTIPAFKKSKEMGFNIVETDVRQTSDGVFVLLHDSKINRTARNSDGTVLSSDISIINITYEQALTYDFGIWKGSEYAGTKIPTLNEFLDLCRNINLSVYLEIESSDVNTENDINSILEMIKRKGMREKVTIICSNLDVLTIIKNIDPAWRIGFIKSSSSPVTLEQISSLKTGYNEVFVNAQQGIVDNILSDDCYNYGLNLECWVPDTESSVIDKAQYVTGITSDFLVAENVLYNYYMNIE